MTPDKLYEEINEILVQTDYHIREVEANTLILYQVIHCNKSGIEIVLSTFKPSDLSMMFAFLKTFAPIMDLTGNNLMMDVYRLHEINESRVKMINAQDSEIGVYQDTIKIQGDKIRKLESELEESGTNNEEI